MRVTNAIDHIYSGVFVFPPEIRTSTDFPSFLNISVLSGHIGK